jgi:hypothetical protein
MEFARFPRSQRRARVTVFDFHLRFPPSSRMTDNGRRPEMWFGRGFLFAGLMLLGWAAIVVAISALTTWWVLFALVPLGMMASCLVMMGTMVRSAGGDPRAGPWAWCAAWFQPSDPQAVQRGTPTEGSMK